MLTLQQSRRLQNCGDLNNVLCRMEFSSQVSFLKGQLQGHLNALKTVLKR